MSVPSSKQANAFLTPLKAKSSTLLLHSREDNLMVARFMLRCLSSLRLRTIVLDANCFYGTNAVVLTSGLPEEFLGNTTLVSIREGSQERSLAGLVMREADAVIIDDMNALRTALSRSNRSSSIHKLFLLIGVLSCEARKDNLTILTTVYRGEPATTERNSKRSLASTTDLRIATEIKSSSVTFSCADIESWPDHKFGANVYFALST